MALVVVVECGYKTPQADKHLEVEDVVEVVITTLALRQE
jgi:hypothetical protein